MSLRPYWKRHPVQLRLIALLLLLTLPVLFPLLAAVMADWSQIGRDYVDQYRQAYRALTRGE